MSESESGRIPLTQPTFLQIDPVNDKLAESVHDHLANGGGSWSSYPKVYNLGHRAVRDILDGNVIVQEKVDGSQISFGKFYIDGEFVLRVRSKGAELNVLAPEGMFKAGVDAIRSIFDLLTPGWTYRGEYLNKPKHNALAYARTPVKNIILFDISVGDQEYMDPSFLKAEGERLGLEVVPLIYAGVINDIQTFRGFLERESILGGQMVEGVVVKNYDRFGPDGKAMFGKFVSESFKEVHKGEWRKENPQSGDILDRLISMYRTPARWNKAIQHLREAGQLEDSPRDIGKLIPEVPRDILAEEGEAIKEVLMKWAWPHIRRGVMAGFPEYYKDELLKRQFENEEA